MFLHSIKIAIRNHCKHKIQSIVSLLSLAIAFACVSLSVFWNYYEHNYDSFLTDYDRIYHVGNKPLGESNVRDYSTLALPSHLMNNYSEIEKACGISSGWYNDRKVEINGYTFSSGSTEITPEAVDMFDIQWVEGNRNINSWKENEVAISEQIAQKVCGKDSPIGQRMVLKQEDGVKTANEFQIAAVFKTRPKHSNFNIDILKRMEDASKIGPSGMPLCNTYIKIKSNADIINLKKKITADTIPGLFANNTYNTLTPLKKVHYTLHKEKRNIRVDDVKLFSYLAVLLSLCALLNYLALFISNLQSKGRDMALRTVYGSSAWQLSGLLLTEYMILLISALLLSMLFIELSSAFFFDLTQIPVTRFELYKACAYLLCFVILLAVLLSLVPILYLKRKTLKVQMEIKSIQQSKSRFRIASLCIQLFISLLFIFCSAVMIKQIHYLIHADINIERKNIAMISSYIGDDRIKDILKQIPSITEMVSTDTPLFPPHNVASSRLRGFENKEELMIQAYEVGIDSEIADFYGIRMKEGNTSFDLASNEYLINETFAKQLGDSDPIGKILPHYIKGIIKGVVYDIQFQPPTEPVRALFFRKNRKTERGAAKNGFTYARYMCENVAFKYTGDFAECQKAIEKAFEEVEERPRYGKYTLKDGETIYNNYLTPEFNILKLLNIITLFSLLIALFGVYALILQECERQRKSIAVRKVFGAQVKDILMMFFKEYMMQVVIASVFAFPIGYVLMKHWLEGYSRQTSIGIEVFLGIFLGMAILVVLCIGWHVWHAANENPATAVKKE